MLSLGKEQKTGEEETR